MIPTWIIRGTFCNSHVKGPGDTDLPDRSVWFDRLDLRAIRQRIFDNDGLIVSDTKYDKWQPYDGVLFPKHIDASFKKDGYGVVINTNAVKMKFGTWR